MTSDFPELVYKYRQWDDDNHKRSITQNEVFFASPSTFNDPFDCRIFENFHLLDTEEKRKEYTDKLLIRTADQWLNGQYHPAKKMIEFEDRLTDVQKFQSEHDSYWQVMQEKHYGVLCLSTQWNNILLWSHYANKHRGFCVGYHEMILRSNFRDRFKGGEVNYQEDYPLLDPLDEDTMRKMYVSTHFKSVVWKYEKEYRISRLLFPEVPTIKDRKILLPIEAIADVTLGLEISKSDKEHIITECKNKNIPVYQSIKVPFRFELQRELIF